MSPRAIVTDDELEDLAAAVDDAMKPATFESLRDVRPTAAQRRSSRAEPQPPASLTAQEIIANMRAHRIEDPDTT